MEPALAYHQLELVGTSLPAYKQVGPALVVEALLLALGLATFQLVLVGWFNNEW